MSTSNHSKLLN